MENAGRATLDYSDSADVRLQVLALEPLASEQDRVSDRVHASDS